MGLAVRSVVYGAAINSPYTSSMLFERALANWCELYIPKWNPFFMILLRPSVPVAYGYCGTAIANGRHYRKNIRFQFGDILIGSHTRTTHTHTHNMCRSINGCMRSWFSRVPQTFTIYTHIHRYISLGGNDANISDSEVVYTIRFCAG